MTRSWMLGSMVLLSGCSLIVPSPGDFTADLADGGQSERDGGRDAGRDAWVDPGTDAGPACEAGLTECDGDCVDIESELAHCGGCGNACAATDRCREGACFDPAVEVAAGPEHTCVRRASGQVLGEQHQRAAGRWDGHRQPCPGSRSRACAGSADLSEWLFVEHAGRRQLRPPCGWSSALLG